jgi:hypothetical protein
MVVVGSYPREYQGLSYRPDSRLLVVEGFVDGSKTASRSYFVWEGRHYANCKNTLLGRPPRCVGCMPLCGIEPQARCSAAIFAGTRHFSTLLNDLASF